MGQRLKTNVYEASHPELGDVVAKFAIFEWEVGYYEAEIEAYSWIEGHGIGPKFLGHLTEEGRVIGFVLQNLHERHACIDDIVSCTRIVERLHALGILHGDLNRHNFLVTDNRTALIDFEACTKSKDEGEKARELQGLKQELLDDSGKGGEKVLDPYIGEQLVGIYKRDGGISDEMYRQAFEGSITMTSEENKKILEAVRAGRTAYVPV